MAFQKATEAANQTLADLLAGQPHQVRLVPLLKRIEVGNAFAATKAACELLKEPVVAIIGPNSNAASLQVLRVSQKHGIPYMVTRWGDEPHLNNVSVDLHPSGSAVGQTLRRFVEEAEEWKQLGLIYTEDEGDVVRYSTYPLFSIYDLILTFRTNYLLILDALHLLAVGIARIISTTSRPLEPPVGVNCDGDTAWVLGPKLVQTMKSENAEVPSGFTGRIEFNELGRRKNMNITVWEISKDGFQEYQQQYVILLLTDSPLGNKYSCWKVSGSVSICYWPAFEHNSSEGEEEGEEEHDDGDGGDDDDDDDNDDDDDDDDDD
ncbi:unnamed protein product, partial [Schistocephalus solidus]